MIKKLAQIEIEKRMELTNDGDKINFLKKFSHQEKVWSVEIRFYIARIKILFEDSKNGKNPLVEYTQLILVKFNVKVDDNVFYK